MTEKELEATAFLARIHIEEGQKEAYLRDVNRMMEYIEILQKPDVSSLKPTTHVTNLRNVWRDDEVKACQQETIETMLDAAPEREGEFYKIKKVIEAQ
ncbi:MAG: Asp-tRNA(Asn)/Glu-tRNA(Gln) amidotransferase subunit GatC [Elusimicrobiota bacterium]|jgi:aspartyl/glutamyl-tRNA(Asn/Gln) amidotransferase C subunit|nr:Asp-tRNA(Asn)/Glu-tRNA(Gln) amidotransferase subunit GatC [Elusimicrobiota bacterium]